MDRTVELRSLISPAKTVRCGDGDYPIMSMTMHDGLVFQDEKFKKVIASKDTSEYKVVYRNQLVISFPIDEGVLAAQRITDAGIVSPAYGIWDIDQSKILPEFLEYALRCNRAIQYYKANLRGSTARRRSLPTPTLLAFTVPLPDIEGQNKILERIHRVSSLIEKRKAQIMLLDELIKVRFVEMFGDPVLNPKGFPVYRMDEVVEFQGGSQPNKKYFEYEPTPYNIRLIQIRDYKTDNYITYIPKAMAKRFCTADDIMIGRYGPPIFQVLQGIEGSFNVALMKATPKMGRKEFVRYFLKQDCLLHYLEGMSKRTAGQDGIQMDKLKSYSFPMPPLELQEQFESFVAQVDKSKVAVQKSLDETQLLFNSLMQKYFG